MTCNLDKIKSECVSPSHACSENKKSFKIERSDKTEKIYKVKVDGCIFPKNQVPERCDFLFIRPKTEEYFFVELKGDKFEKAYQQLKTTIAYYKKDLGLKPEQISAFMVTSGLNPKANLNFMKLKEEFYKQKIGKVLIKATDSYTHKL